MLRSFILSLLAFMAIVGAFALYWLAQPRVVVAPLNKAMKVPTTAPAVPTQMQIGPGNGAWVNSYDRLGRLVSQFNAQEYTPKGNNTFAVVKPVCKFYLAGGQFVILAGETGTVYVDAGKPSEKGFGMATAQAPNRGRLKHVHIALFPHAGATRPTEWMDVDNMAFDNDTLRLFTEPFINAAGQHIAADRVPIRIRGDEYEFDGKGLVLRWNDRDARVQLLEIAQGSRLLIKDTKKMATPWAPSPPPTPTRTVALAVAPKVKPAGHAKVTPKVAKPAGPTIYQAVFQKNVRVFENGRLNARGDTLKAVFVNGQTPSTKPQTAAAPSTAKPAATKSAAPPTSSSQAKGHATTQPAPDTAEVRWTGTLRLTPIQTTTPPAAPIAPAKGSTVVQLIGNPAIVTPLHSKLTAATMTYRTGDSAAVLTPSPAQPTVRFINDRGVKFTGHKIVYNPATQIATLTGPASLVQPVENQPGKFTSAHWAGPGYLHVVPHENQPEFVDHGDLHQNVVIDHPQFHLTSDRLTFDLSRAAAAKPSASPTIRLDRVTGIGQVKCTVARAGEPKRDINADRLTLLMRPDAAGKSSPHELLADGHVLASDPSQELAAGHLDAVLASKPNTVATKTGATNDAGIAIKTVHATDAVHVELKSGAIADADELWLTTPHGNPQIDLHSTTAAHVNDGKGSVLSGKHIRLLPDQSIVRVLGPGRLNALRPGQHGAPAKRINVTWQHLLDVNESVNTADADGTVTAISKQPDGTVDTLIGDHVHGNLMNAVPTTRPAAVHARTKATTSPAKSLAGNKTLKDMTVNGNVMMTSILTGTDGKVLKLDKLLTSKMTYNALTGVAVIPGPGRLLSENHQSPTTAPATANASPMSSHGITAVAWHRDATYTPANQQIVLRGNTLVAFSKTADQKVPMRLASQRLTIQLAKSSSATKPKTGEPATQVSHVTASQQVHLTSADIDFVAHQVDYDPNTGDMIAIGTPAEPAEIQRGTTTGHFRRLLYNVKNDMVKQIDGLSAGTP